MNFFSIKDKLISDWRAGQQSEPLKAEDDDSANSILTLMMDQINDASFSKEIREKSATFKDSEFDHSISIEFPRWISISAKKWNELRKTAIIKRIRQLSGLRVSIANNDQTLAQPVKKGDNFKRRYLLKVTVYLTKEDLGLVSNGINRFAQPQPQSDNEEEEIDDGQQPQ